MTEGMLQRSGAPTQLAVDPVLSIRNLSVELSSPSGYLRAVDGLSLDVGAGQTVAIVGESGCGKTMTALAVLGIVPGLDSRISGVVRFDGEEIQQHSSRQLRHIRGAGISMVFQEPVSALNPVFSIGQQIAAVIRAHEDVSRRDATARAVDLLTSVGIPDAAARIREYPHQWSGGMCQRAIIAMAIANRPRLIIADEPTTALDVTVQAQVLDVLQKAQRDTGAAALLITHDLGVVAELTDVVAVMYARRLVEVAGVRELFADPRHPYTQGLLASVPRLDDSGGPVPIPGQPPQLHRIPSGCSFHPRCALSQGRHECRTSVPALEVANDSGRRSACHFHTEMEAFPAPVELRQRRRTGRVAPGEPVEGGTSADAVLSVEDLVVHFPVRTGPLRRVTGRVQAVDGVSFSIRPGETVGLVGESGCGKSTIAHAVMRLLEPTSGTIRFAATDLSRFSRRQLREVRQALQIVFQDPHASLNPKMKVGDIIAEPLRIHDTHGRRGRWARVRELLEMVGLDEVHIERFPHEFSGGQLQRVGIARALALDPRVLVLDEPVSALDVSIQAQVLALLEDLQDRLGLAYLFISHDLSVVHHICDRVSVMYLGRIVESGPVEQLYRSPQHPYTQSLLDAVPRPDPSGRDRRSRIVLTGDMPSASDPPSGCRFRSRCWRADERCTTEPPARAIDGAIVACHHPGPSEPVT